MPKILSKRFYSENVAEFIIEAPLIARSRRAGHFVIVRVDEHSERMPLTISNANTENGTITLVVQRIGVSSAKLMALEVGDELHNIVGPLGKATNIQRFGTVVCACGGVGAAPMLPIAQALKQAGNKVITILAARTAELIILKEQLAEVSDELIIMTDDGSLGQKGLVTMGVEQVIQREQVDKCITIGPAVMMKFVALTTKKYEIPTEASLNTIMVDGTGMCGACRVTVGGKTKFVCVDGPEFDAHTVDFDEMLSRLRQYKAEESLAYEAYLSGENSNDIPNVVNCQSEQSTCFEVAPFEGKAKDRVAIPRVKMPELKPEERIQSIYNEVNQGLTFEQAITEAHRCLDCKNPTCVKGCPVNINIPGFIKQLEIGNVLSAAEIIQQSSTLPAVCGRVCPQEKQCEAQCIHLKMGHDPVAIGYLERFVADNAYKLSQSALVSDNISKPSTRGKIAVVGSGPAGLAFAGDMAKYGYEVVVFEALHEIGGVLKYGIPEFRLPNSVVDREIEGLRRLGVKFQCDTIVGKTLTMSDLQSEGFIGVFVGSGAGLPRFMGIPGENLNGVLSCNEYLTRVNLMGASQAINDTPLLNAKNVMVVGGGNTAMDAVRTAKRLGAERAMIVYRRSEEEMPARLEEVRHAKEEGIEFICLHNPIAYHADEQGRVSGAILQVMTLGEPDESGRRSPVEVPGSEFEIETDTVIMSLGTSPNPLIAKTTAGLETNRRGCLVANENGATTRPGVFAGGDAVTGAATVILAMGAGRKAAAAIHEYIMG